MDREITITRVGEQLRLQFTLSSGTGKLTAWVPLTFDVREPEAGEVNELTGLNGRRMAEVINESGSLGYWREMEKAFEMAFGPGTVQ